MKQWVAKSTNAPFAVPFSRILVSMNGREHVASLLDCVAGWAERGARVYIAGLVRAPSGGDATFRAAQRVCNRVTLAATVDAACETLAWRGIEAEKAIFEPDADAAQTETLAGAMRNWQAELMIGAPSWPVELAGMTDCPVLVLPVPFARRCRVPPQRIFVASDGGAASAVAIREAARVAAPGAAVRVGYLACDPAQALHPEEFEAVVLDAQHDGGATSHAIGEAAQQWRADLLVLGTQGALAGGHWRSGNVAADVAKRAVLPLLLVPPASKCSTLA